MQYCRFKLARKIFKTPFKIMFTHHLKDFHGIESHYNTNITVRLKTKDSINKKKRAFREKLITTQMYFIVSS